MRDQVIFLVMSSIIFLAHDSTDLLHEIFWYFNLPQRRLDYQSDLEALDYFIKHYREVFIIPGKET